MRQPGFASRGRILAQFTSLTGFFSVGFGEISVTAYRLNQKLTRFGIHGMKQVRKSASLGLFRRRKSGSDGLSDAEPGKRPTYVGSNNRMGGMAVSKHDRERVSSSLVEIGKAAKNKIVIIQLRGW